MFVLSKAKHAPMSFKIKVIKTIPIPKGSAYLAPIEIMLENAVEL